MNKITSLTPKNIEAMTTYRDKWLEIGLDTTPIDRAKARAAIEHCYRIAKIDPPKIFIWLESPFRGAIGATYLKIWDQVRDQVGDQVRDQVWDQVGAQVGDPVWAQVGAQVWAQVRAQVRDQVGDPVWAQVRAQVGDQVWAQVGAQVRAQVGAQVGDPVRDQVWDQVGAQVGDPVWAQVWDQVGDQVWAQVGAQVRAQVRAQVGDPVRDQVWDQVGDQVWDQVGAQVWDQVNKFGYGLHDANWLAFYEYFQRELGLEYCAQLDGLNESAKQCGWWWPFQNAVIVTSKPSAIHRDESYRLHCENGLALMYPDGWGIYAWHGVRVPEKVIVSPQSITIEEITSEQNAEIRRVMMERMGWETFCSKAKMKTIHADTLEAKFPALPVSDLVDSGQRLVTTYRKGTETAELLESAELRDFEDRPLRFVRLTDPSTGRQYTIRVLHNHKKCYEAIGWTFGLSEKEYKNSVLQHS